VVAERWGVSCSDATYVLNGISSCSTMCSAAPSVVSANDVEALVESYVELVCNDLMTGRCPCCFLQT
jgi:hypothetical protein